MEYENQVKLAVMNGLFAHFGVMPVDIVCESLKYQQAMQGTHKILAILSDEQKGALFMEYQNATLRREQTMEIAEKIEQLKKFEFANKEAIKAQQHKLEMSIAEGMKAVHEMMPKLLEMMNEFCTAHVQDINRDNDDFNALT